MRLGNEDADAEAALHGRHHARWADESSSMQSLASHMSSLDLNTQDPSDP
jgi:hypothetical protein